MIKFHIVGGDRLGTAAWLAKYRDKFERSNYLMEADMLVYTGGEDIGTRLYGEKPTRYTDGYSYRDAEEVAAYHWGVENGKLHFGICRGHQLLWVLNGGKLWQHIEGHRHGPNASIVLREGKILPGVTTAHHQAARPTQEQWEKYVLGWSPEPHTQGFYMEEDWQVSMRTGQIVEVMRIPETRCFGVQGHPEFYGASQEFQDYVINNLLEMA